MLTMQEVRQLERLTISGGGAHAASGRRHAPARGRGLEFRDHRHYQPGDDPRLIDWTVDARHRQLVVRTFRAEALLRLHLLVDTSASMSIGRPSKLAFASRLAAALAYVAVERRDALGLATFDEEIRTLHQPAVGRPQLFRVLEELRALRAAGGSTIDRALTTFGAAVRGPGLVVVLSDFFDVQDRLDGLHFLMHRGLTPVLVQVMADEDLDPEVDDDSELFDAEQPSTEPMIADRSVIRAYQNRVVTLSADLERFCRTNQLTWVQLRSSTAFDLAIAACQKSGLLALHV